MLGWIQVILVVGSFLMGNKIEMQRHAREVESLNERHRQEQERLQQKLEHNETLLQREKTEKKKLAEEISKMQGTH